MLYLIIFLIIPFIATVFSNQTTDGNCNCLLAAASSGSVERVRRLLSTEKQHGDCCNGSVLAAAVINGHIAVAQLLVEHGADVSYVDSETGYSLLLRTIKESSGHLQAVHWLIHQGVDVNLQGKDGHTALTLAARLGRQDVVLVLLQRSGANVRSRDANDWTALTWSAYNGLDEAVCQLILNGASVDATTDVGDSAMAWAAAKCHLSTVRLLLEHGANAGLRNVYGESAMTLAAIYDCQQVVDLLLSTKCNI